MGLNAKIVIIEKDLADAARLSLDLGNLGYDIKGIFSRPKEALSYIKDNHPDIVLLHERLKGELNGLEVSTDPRYPVIYFSKNPETNGLLKEFPVEVTADPGFAKKSITKSIKKLQKKSLLRKKFRKNLSILKDRIFVRNRDRMVKISLDDIRFIEADRNYCKVYTGEKHYLLVSTLKDVNEKLKDNRFLRVHRSYMVNLSHLDEVAANHLIIGNKIIPLSKAMRGELLKHLQVI